MRTQSQQVQHHGGERPCAGPQRQETQTYLRYGPIHQLHLSAWLRVGGTLKGPLLVRFVE